MSDSDNSDRGELSLKKKYKAMKKAYAILERERDDLKAEVARVHELRTSELKMHDQFVDTVKSMRSPATPADNQNGDGLGHQIGKGTIGFMGEKGGNKGYSYYGGNWNKGASSSNDSYNNYYYGNKGASSKDSSYNRNGAALSSSAASSSVRKSGNKEQQRRADREERKREREPRGDEEVISRTLSRWLRHGIFEKWPGLKSGWCPMTELPQNVLDFADAHGMGELEKLTTAPSTKEKHESGSRFELRDTATYGKFARALAKHSVDVDMSMGPEGFFNEVGIEQPAAAALDPMVMG